MLQRLLFVLMGLALVGVQPAFGKNPPPKGCPTQIIDHDAIRALTEKMLIKVVRPVLEEAGRFGGSGIQIDLPNNGLGRIDVRTSHGTFHIQLTREDKPKDSDLGEAIPPFDFDQDFRMTGVVLIQERWLEDSFLKRDKNLELIQGLVRCLMIGDPNVSPHMRSPRAPDGQESELSYLQQDVFQEAITAIGQYRAREPNRVPRLGIMGPGGMGKTILVGKLAKEFFASRGQTDGVVVFTVHSDSILNSARDKLVRELGLKDDEVWVHYGNDKAKDLPPNPGKIKLVLTSRTGLKQLCDRQHIDQVIKPGGRKRSAMLVKDEAQHIPAADDEDGEYMQAMAHLEGKIGVTADQDNTSNRLLNEEDLILMISATLTHSKNPGLISDRRFLDGSVIGVLLDQAEQDQLRGGNNTDVMNLAVTQSLRAMVRGYLAWINFVQVELIRDSEGKKVLNRTVVELDDKGNRVRREVVDQGAVDKVAKQIMRVRAEHPQVVNRTLIFVDGTRRAELWAQMLQDKLHELEGGLAHPSVVHHHSSKPNSFREAEDWLMDRQVKRHTRGGTLLGTDYNTDADRATHKYVVVDSKMGEGTDVPCINMIVIAREVDASDTGAMVRLFQNILRGTRVFAYKQRLHLLDYSGAVTPLLERRLTLRPLLADDDDDDDGDGDGDDEPPPPPPPIGDPLATQMRLFGQNPITELILAAQSGQATEYGSDVSIEDVWLLRRMPFDTRRPEGQHLAKLVLKLLRSTASVDIATLWAGSEADKEYARKLSASGLFALVEQYKSIHDRIKQVFKDYADFLALKDAGLLPDEEESTALELMLVEAGNDLSSDIAILDFGQKTRKYVMALDPMRGKPMQMTLVYRGDGRLDPRLLENMEELYRAVGDQRNGGLYELEHQSFWMTTQEASVDRRVVKIVGENVWPFLYADVGRHVWTNQPESGTTRGGALHSKDVVVFAEAEQEKDLMALPKPIRDKMTALATTSSGFPIVRKYDAKANPTPEIRSNDFPLMPGPMRASAYIQSGKLLLDPRGMHDYASILRRNMSVYFVPLLEQQLVEVQPYLPKPPADAAPPVVDGNPPPDGETPTADPTSPPDQP